MRVLILGSHGMLGQELARAFSGYEVIAWDREDLDITNQSQVFQKIKKLKLDIILNAAAYNAVDKAEEEKYLAFAVNAEAVKYLALAAKEIGAIFVHFSTDYVFEGVKKEGYKEDDAINPQSVYAQSKAKGEEYLREIKGLYYLIRLSRLFGKPGMGDGSKKSFVDVVLNLAENKPELEVIDEELSSPTYAPDLASLIKEIIDQKYPFGIYHGANSGACTWYEFAQEALKSKNISCLPRTNSSEAHFYSKTKAAGDPLRPSRLNDKFVNEGLVGGKLIPVPASRFPRPALRPKYSILLNTKLTPSRSWQEALKEYLNL